MRPLPQTLESQTRETESTLTTAGSDFRHVPPAELKGTERQIPRKEAGLCVLLLSPP
jgi:hypothetical protein